MTTYRSTHRRRLRRLRAALTAAWVGRLAGHALAATGGVCAGVGLALGLGGLVLVSGCAVVLGLALAASAERVGRRGRGASD